MRIASAPRARRCRTCARRPATIAAALVLGAGTLGAPGRLAAQKLPVVEVPATSDTASVPGSPLAFVFSGDGNWSGADKEVAEAFAKAGIPVVGLEARSYLRQAHRTPEGVAADVGGLLETYLTRWKRTSVVLIGYSRGADLMPFIVNRLDPEMRTRIRMVALLDPEPNASFTFHFSDLLRDKRRPSDLPVVPEIERMAGLRIVCVYGTEESNSACPLVPPGLVDVVQRPGHHRMGGEGTDVAGLLLARLRS